MQARLQMVCGVGIIIFKSEKGFGLCMHDMIWHASLACL